MHRHLRNLVSYRSLLWLWTLRELRIRYKQSVLGVGWAVLQPLAMMIVLTLVFSLLARIPTDGIPYPVFVLTALLPWTFLSNALSGAVTSLTSNMTLVQKVYFPREVLPAGVVLAAFADLLIASLLLLPLFVFYGVPINRSLVWIPALLLLQLVLCLGLGLLLAALCVRFRDIRFVVPLTLQLWLFASPVIYPVSLIPDSLRTLYMVNPMAGLIESLRAVSLRGVNPDFASLLYSAFACAALLLVGYIFFKGSESEFADII